MHVATVTNDVTKVPITPDYALVKDAVSQTDCVSWHAASRRCTEASPKVRTRGCAPVQCHQSNQARSHGDWRTGAKGKDGVAHVAPISSTLITGLGKTSELRSGIQGWLLFPLPCKSSHTNLRPRIGRQGHERGTLSPDVGGWQRVALLINLPVRSPRGCSSFILFSCGHSARAAIHTLHVSNPLTAGALTFGIC